MVFVNCNQGENPVIKWIYPNEEEQSRNANEYNVTGASKVQIWQLGLSSEPNTSIGELYREDIYLYGFTGAVVAFEASQYSWWIGAECKNIEHQEYQYERQGQTPPPRTSRQIALQEQYPGYCIVGAEVRSGLEELYPSDPILIRSFGYTNTANQVTFEVKNQGGLLYTRTTPRAPQITTECLVSSGCPENTCEVICGDTVCCYGSNGIAVHSFTRT